MKSHFHFLQSTILIVVSDQGLVTGSVVVNIRYCYYNIYLSVLPAVSF